MTTPEALDARDCYRKDFGTPLGDVTYAFRSRLIQLHRRWHDYEVLYFDDVSIGILNATAPNFFERHRQMAFETVVMALARLSDPDRTGRFENLSVQYLLSLVTSAQRDALNPYADAAQTSSAFARTWRHKRFAHNDMNDAVGAAPAIALVNRIEIDNAVRALNDFDAQLHVICGGYSQAGLHDACKQDDFGGASVLLERLHEGQEARAARQARIVAGDIRADDFKEDPIITGLYERRR